jgi:hypothetical protein
MTASKIGEILGDGTSDAINFEKKLAKVYF